MSDYVRGMTIATTWAFQYRINDTYGWSFNDQTEWWTKEDAQASADRFNYRHDVEIRIVRFEKHIED